MSYLKKIWDFLQYRKTAIGTIVLAVYTAGVEAGLWQYSNSIVLLIATWFGIAITSSNLKTRNAIKSINKEEK